ncbi:MAG: methionine--tRNA ligase [Candidatus Aenigmarchaeota archaeon]|nr:methionine--tRNA ligase [Candidatus Aenigmarchaeota archaeon]
MRKKVIRLTAKKIKKRTRVAKKAAKQQKKSKNFYITTAIPYVNADPHIGHALEFIQTDCIRRYYQLLGCKTFLTTGADENSLKNVQAAEAKGVTPQELCATNAEKFRRLAISLGMEFDSFLRSSVPEAHFPGSQKLWKRCAKDIYKKKYKGLYCVGCEAFYTESELKEGRCPEHDRKPEEVEEENYFFRLSKYQKQLERLIRTNALRIIPETRKHEVLSFVRSGLEDFSVSRSTSRAKGWGVPVPGDASQIMYVWFDALNIYQTAVGFGTNEKLYNQWWPCDCHVIGKGILRFHAVYWPAILLSAGLQPPKSVFVHGYITVEGKKMSKSLGNVVNPVELIDRCGAERLRYFLLHLPAFDDGDFSERALVERTNHELVENFSNLFYRITYFIEKNFGGTVPKGRPGKNEKAVQRRFTETAAKKFTPAMESFRLHEALGHVMELSTELNKYFQNAKPWEHPRDGTPLYVSVNLLKDICILLYPFLPLTSERALKALGCGRDINAIGSLSLKPGHRIKSEKLFEKIEHKPAAMAAAPTEKAKSSGKETIRMARGLIPFEEFAKLDLRIGTITDVKDHPNADKLYVMQVDLGTEKKQIVNGMKGIYRKDELQNRQVIVVCNMEPKDFRGVRSDAMLLAADDGTLLVPVKPLISGMKVR